jgi:6-phosphogluconolactonase
MIKTNHRWHVLPDPQILADKVAKIIEKHAQAAIRTNSVFKIVLAGGTTPEKVYQRLVRIETDWSCWSIYFGDERCLPSDHPQRNSVMAAHSWLEHVPVPASNIHPIPAEQGAEKAAQAYSQVVSNALPFDLVLLGMGEDGHTASLFPGQRHDMSELVHPVYDAPKPPAERVSLSIEALNNSDAVIILVTGAAKSHALQQLQAGDDLPIAAIHGHNGCDIYLDVAAQSKTN